MFTKKWMIANPEKEKIRRERVSEAKKGVKRPDLSEYNRIHNKAGQDHPRWNSKLIKCFYCGKEIYRPQWRLKRKIKHLFCSKHCSAKFAHSGEKNWNWKGGVSPKNRLIRTSVEYGLWRKEVFKRDNYTCQKCGKNKCYIHAHHIKPFAKYPELRLVISNGITLCKSCHELTKERGRNGRYN